MNDSSRPKIEREREREKINFEKAGIWMRRMNKIHWVSARIELQTLQCKAEVQWRLIKLIYGRNLWMLLSQCYFSQQHWLLAIIRQIPYSNRCQINQFLSSTDHDFCIAHKERRSIICRPLKTKTHLKLSQLASHGVVWRWWRRTGSAKFLTSPIPSVSAHNRRSIWCRLTAIRSTWFCFRLANFHSHLFWGGNSE